MSVERARESIETAANMLEHGRPMGPVLVAIVRALRELTDEVDDMGEEGEPAPYVPIDKRDEPVAEYGPDARRGLEDE